jgi:hypothetical protein
VKVQDVLPVLPAGVTVLSISDGGTETSGTVTWSFPSVTSGWSKDLTLVIKPGSEGTISNTATSSVEGSGVLSTATSNAVLTEIVPCSDTPEFPTMLIPAALLVSIVLIAGYLKRKEQ